MLTTLHFASSKKNAFFAKSFVVNLSLTINITDKKNIERYFLKNRGFDVA